MYHCLYCGTIFETYRLKPIAVELYSAHVPKLRRKKKTATTCMQAQSVVAAPTARKHTSNAIQLITTFAPFSSCPSHSRS